MSKRKKSSKRRKLAIATFGLESDSARYEAEPLHQRKFSDGDIKWIADEYRKQVKSDPSLRLADFAEQYGAPVDQLRFCFPELSEGVSQSLVAWHGTSCSRARLILKEGFLPKTKKGEARRIFFTQNPVVARGYAQRRAKSERDSPAVIICAIDLNEYNDYEQRGEGVYAFKAECISNEVVRNVIGLKKQEQKRSASKGSNKSIRLTDIALTFGSNSIAVAYWINSYLTLNDDCKLDENHAAVREIKKWLDKQAETGRFEEVPDDEMLEQVRKHLPHYSEN